MTVDLQELANQFTGRRLAELILAHVDSGNMQQMLHAIQGLLEELPEPYRQATTELLDFLTAMPQSEARRIFTADCGEQFIELVNVACGFFLKTHGIHLTKDEAFTVFNIIVQNYAYSCLRSPSTMVAMRKAAGKSLLRRLFGG